MLNGLWQEIKLIEKSSKKLKEFAFLVGPILVVLGFIFFDSWARYLLVSIGGALLILGWIAPQALRKLYLGWMILAVILGFLMSRLLLVIIYFCAILPIGLLMKITGRDSLNLKKKSKPSHWDLVTESEENNSEYPF